MITSGCPRIARAHVIALTESAIACSTLRRYASAWTLALALLSLTPSAQAQAFDYLSPKPFDPSWEPVPDPTLDCSLLPERGPNPYDLGLAAALAAAERRDLTLGGLGTTLLWAEREADPAHVPALKRLVEEYRCFDGDAHLALNAIEAAGEPSDYFLGLVRDWRRDDTLAGSAMEVLGVRRDSSAAETIRAVALEAPPFANRGTLLNQRQWAYLKALRMWAEFDALPLAEQLRFAMRTNGGVVRNGVVIRGVRGDSLSQLENLTVGYGFAIPKRALRQLARVSPSAYAEALDDYEVEARAVLARRGIAAEHVPLFLDLVRQHSQEYADVPPLPAEPSTSPPDRACEQRASPAPRGRRPCCVSGCGP